MRLNPFKRRVHDLEDLFLEISASLPEGYTALDRYRDFRAVFLSSEQGKRVLHDILSWGHCYRTSVPAGPIDPYRTHVSEGERNLALKILSALNVEPKARPAQSNSKKV